MLSLLPKQKVKYCLIFIELFSLVHSESRGEKENAGYIQLPEEINDVNNDDNSAKGTVEHQQGTQFEVDTNLNPSKQGSRSSLDQQISTDNFGEKSGTNVAAQLYANSNLSFTENSGMQPYF